MFLRSGGAFAPERDGGGMGVGPVCSCCAFHTRFVGPGVGGVVGLRGFSICLVVFLSLSCSGVGAPLVCVRRTRGNRSASIEASVTIGAFCLC